MLRPDGPDAQGEVVPLTDALNALFARMMIAAQSLRDGEKGQGMVEYALVITLVALGAVVAFTALTGRLSAALGAITF
jgi:Flp pilus assembly pilin Flp